MKALQMDANEDIIENTKNGKKCIRVRHFVLLDLSEYKVKEDRSVGDLSKFGQLFRQCLMEIRCSAHFIGNIMIFYVHLKFK